MKRIFVALLFVWTGALFAQDQDIMLDRIVVTPYRYEEELARTPASTTIITQADIEASNALTVLDVLRPVPGLVVRDWIGNATKASVDIRGFGEQSGMNVAVLVDGRRVNEADLSSVDWTQIPLNQVKSIEITRGGNSVLYGDNAVGGVIHIITKKGRGKPKFETGAHVGSYDYTAQNFSASGSKDALSYWFSASREGMNGYRNNSFYKANDFAAKLGYETENNLSLRFESGYHRASFGFPGALTASDIEKYGRRYSKYGDDRATEKDYYFVAGTGKEFGSLGAFDMDTSFRRKQVKSNFIGANAGWNPILYSFIDTYGLTPKYTLENPVFGFTNKLLTGVDVYRYYYAAQTFGSTNVQQDYTDINKTTIGGYLQDEFSIFKNLIAVGGFRYEGAAYAFNYHTFGFPSDIDTKTLPNEKAFNGGLIYRYQEDSSVFANINQSFRFPATDEYFTWGALTTSLEPQTSRNYEVGIRHRFNQEFKCDLSLFRMDVDNELYYNPLGGPFGFGANENYDKTQRQGVEFAFDAKLTKDIGFFGNYSYIKPVFKDGVYKGNDIPMVSRNKGSVGLKFSLPKGIDLTVTGDYVGKRYFINDQMNVYSQLNGYMTADANISYTFKDFRVTAGVNNLFDKEYSEYGVCNSMSGAKNYYPNPARNFNVKLDYTF